MFSQKQISRLVGRLHMMIWVVRLVQLGLAYAAFRRFNETSASHPLKLAMSRHHTLILVVLVSFGIEALLLRRLYRTIVEGIASPKRILAGMLSMAITAVSSSAIPLLTFGACYITLRFQGFDRPVVHVFYAATMLGLVLVALFPWRWVVNRHARKIGLVSA